jgi:hypothetical protein
MTKQRWRTFFGLSAFAMVLATVGVPLAAAATASWEFDTPSYSFGPKPYGSGPTESHEFLLTNTGETQIVAKATGYKWASVAAWIKDGPPFHITSSDCRNRVLEPTESCFVAVDFEPLHEGPWGETVMVKSQNEEAPIASVKVSGEGTGPSIPAKPDHVDFESVAIGTTSAPQAITLEEQSSYSYQLNYVFFGPWPGQGASSGPFRIVGDTCQGIQLDPGTTCTVEVVMAPTEIGTFQDELDVYDVAPESPQTVKIEGNAVPAPLPIYQPPDPSGGAVAVSSLPSPTTSSPPEKRRCPKGKQKVMKKGRPLCVKPRKHHRHGVHAGRR